jgi:hypothetical protein
LPKSIAATLLALSPLPNCKQDIVARQKYTEEAARLLANRKNQFTGVRQKVERIRLIDDLMTRRDTAFAVVQGRQECTAMES